jgi:hypothetical protein
MEFFPIFTNTSTLQPRWSSRVEQRSLAKPISRPIRSTIRASSPKSTKVVSFRSHLYLQSGSYKKRNIILDLGEVAEGRRGSDLPQGGLKLN